jgi:hypothetical protein
MSKSGINKILTSDAYEKFKEKLKQPIVEKIQEIFRAHAIPAAEKIAQLAQTGNLTQRLQFDAAKEVLYQVGAKPKDIVETITRKFSAEETVSAKQTLQEIEAVTDRLIKSPSKFVIKARQVEVTKSTTGTAESAGMDSSPKNTQKESV